MDMELCGGAEEGWETPKRAECRIPSVFACPPPPPRKKPVVVFPGRRDPPKDGYFQPPDLEEFFTPAPRREGSTSGA